MDKIHKTDKLKVILDGKPYYGELIYQSQNLKWADVWVYHMGIYTLAIEEIEVI